MNKIYKFKYGKVYFKHSVAAFDHLVNNYQGNGGTSLSMMDKTSRINLFIKTDLDDKVCRKIGMQKIETAMIQTMVKDLHDMAVIDNAGLLIN